MKKQSKIMEIVEKATKFAEDHQREIMLGTAIAGTVFTAIASWKAGIKADKVMTEQKAKMEALDADYANEEIGMTEEEFKNRRKELTVETVKQMAPIVAPVAIAASGTIISVIAGYKVASNQIAVLSSLYSMSEKALTEFQDKTKEIAGPKKAQEIADGVKADHVKEAPPEKAPTVLNTGHGTTLCLDDQSGRYFYSNPEDIRKAFNIINKRIMDEYYVSLNELYDELGLPPITLGDDLGFNVDDGLVDIEHIFTASLHNETPILVVNYDVSPKFMEHRGKMFR